MDNKRAIEVKNILSDCSALTLTEDNDVLRENIKKYSDDDPEKKKFLENIPFLESTVKFQIPNEMLVNKIIQQVEFLFSDANILKDKFLLKHIKRNKEGYVSLKLISSLRKVKALSKDWRVVAYSLQKSEKLQINSEMTKIKRIDPLPIPELLDTNRTVLVIIYRPNVLTFETIKKQLQRWGNIESFVILNNYSEVKDPNLKKTFLLHGRSATFPLALVTFGTAEEMVNAIHQTSRPASLLKLVPLVGDENEASKTANLKEENQSFDKIKESTSIFAGRKDIPFVNPSRGKRKPKPASSCASYKGDCSNNSSNSRWSQGKNKVIKDTLKSQKPFMAVLRQPEGPDGTKGFHQNKTNSPTIK